jgi:hypothetical protein
MLTIQRPTDDRKCEMTVPPTWAEGDEDSYGGRPRSRSQLLDGIRTQLGSGAALWRMSREALRGATTQVIGSYAEDRGHVDTFLAETARDAGETSGDCRECLWFRCHRIRAQSLPFVTYPRCSGISVNFTA